LKIKYSSSLQEIVTSSSQKGTIPVFPALRKSRKKGIRLENVISPNERKFQKKIQQKRWKPHDLTGEMNKGTQHTSS